MALPQRNTACPGHVFHDVSSPSAGRGFRMPGHFYNVPPRFKRYPQPTHAAHFVLSLFLFFFALFFRTFLCAGKYNRAHAGIQRYREIRILLNSLRSSISPLVGEFFFFLDRAFHRVQLRFNHVEFRNIDNIFIRVYLIWKLRDKFIYIGLATK